MTLKTNNFKDANIQEMLPAIEMFFSKMAEMHKLLFEIQIKDELRPLLKISEVARWLNVNDKYIRGLIEKGVIPFIKIRKHIRFKREILEKWVEAGCHPIRRLK